MQASKIQLDHYFLSGLNYSVNQDFDPGVEVRIKLSDITEEHDIQPLDDSAPGDWQVALKVAFSPSEDSNAPYSFSAEIVGLFSVHESIAVDKVYAFVNANATSVLYSTLREIVYTITAKGPYFPLLLPTLCFYERKEDESASNTESDQQAEKDDVV